MKPIVLVWWLALILFGVKLGTILQPYLEPCSERSEPYITCPYGDEVEAFNDGSFLCINQDGALYRFYPLGTFSADEQ